jgi:acyl-CoA reductase-like NAD-dependent aldehyde dehydrogenase
MIVKMKLNDPDKPAGAMFNSGQSCCGIERIYVHSTIYDQFIASFARTASLYKLGDPRLKETNLGPVVSVASKERIDRQVQEALDKGARNLISPGTYDEEAMGRVGKGFVPPVVLVDVDHGMEVMMEEVSSLPFSLHHVP